MKKFLTHKICFCPKDINFYFYVYKENFNDGKDIEASIDSNFEVKFEIESLIIKIYGDNRVESSNEDKFSSFKKDSHTYCIMKCSICESMINSVWLDFNDLKLDISSQTFYSKEYSLWLPKDETRLNYYNPDQTISRFLYPSIKLPYIDLSKFKDEQHLSSKVKLYSTFS